MLKIGGMYHFLSAVTQTLTLSVTDTSTRTCQWGLKSDVIIVTSLIRDLSDMDTSRCPFGVRIREIQLYLYSG